MLIPEWVGFVYILGPCGSLQQTFLWSWEFLLLLPQPPQAFSVKGFEPLFPRAGALGCVVCLAPQLFLPVYPNVNVEPPSPPAATGPPPLLTYSPPWLPVSAPPTCLENCFSFKSLVVGLPHSSIFWQFWLFFVFKFVVVLLLVVQRLSTYASILAGSWDLYFLNTCIFRYTCIIK